MYQAISIAIGIIFGIAFTFLLVPFSHKFNSRDDYSECQSILQSTILVNKLPLTLEVNRSAHQTIYIRLNFSYKRIELLITIRSKVIKELTFIRAAFIKYLLNTIYIIYQPNRKKVLATVREDIINTYNYLKEATAQAEILTDYYNRIRATYNKLYTSTRAELYHTQINNK